MDGPSLQLHEDLRQSVISSLALRRPLLHHLNSDSSWLLQVPRPLVAVQHSGRHWFNILIDPWLGGSQSDVAPWFSQQWHATTPAVGSIAALEELARDIETLSGDATDLTAVTSSRRSSRKTCLAPVDQLVTLIDAITISHEFTDHCHKGTLLQCHRDITVLATSRAAKLIQSWDHFRTVLETPVFPGPDQDSDWRQLSIPPLPEWLGIGRLMSERDALYYHSAIMITFKRSFEDAQSKYAIDSSIEDDAAEAITYTPHGIHAPDLRIVATASPPISTLAFLHGLHDIAIPMQQLNLGAHNGLQAQRLLRPKYWIGTHDAQKVGGGVVSYFLKRKVITLEDALKHEREERQRKDELYGKWREGDGLDKVPEFLELENGESFVLK